MQVPDYFEFNNRVKIISGHRVLEKIPEILGRLKSSRPLLITDRGVEQAGLIKVLKNAVGRKITIGALFDEVPADSELKVINRVSALFRKNRCDSIIAVGGGSVMDTAKAVNILVSENSDNLMQFAGFGTLKRKPGPLIAVPTTSGTGSEMTIVAVIADHERGIKMLFPSPFLLPDAAVLDPRMTLTLPGFLTAATGMDAMTHACEAYTCMSKNPLSDATALRAIEMIRINIVKAVKKPSDAEARLALAVASSLAGMSFSNSMVGMVHAIGHSVGAVCHVPHGICMSILLPYGLEYNLHKSGHYTAELLLPLAGEEVYRNTPRKERAAKAIETVRRINMDLREATGGRHPTCLKEIVDKDGVLAVPEEVLPEIAELSLNDGSLIYNPEEMDYDDMMMVLSHAWEGTALDFRRIKKGRVAPCY